MIPDFSSYLHPYKRGLTAPQMEINALVIGTYLRSIGWSFNAMAAALGNWEAECKLNPNLPTNKKFPANQTGAFGLPQWNPWGSRYGEYCRRNGIPITASDDNQAARIEHQLAYHEWECRPGGGYWIPTQVNKYSWESWKRSQDSPELLAQAYYWEYERSGSGAGNRPKLARKWADFLKGKIHPPIWLLYKFKEVTRI